MRSFFDLELSEEQWAQIVAHAERDHPNEACGLGFGPPEGPIVRVAPIANVQDKYHAHDPASFPRDGKSAFRMDELQRMRELEAADAAGHVERLVYHSHPEAGAYFSAEDRAQAVREGVEMVPGAVHLVLSVRAGQCIDAAAFRYDPAVGRFEEVRLFSDAEDSAPDLELRAMEGGEAQRPIPPVGGRLSPRLVTESERARLQKLASGDVLVVDDDIVILMQLFGRGLLSPLTGFMRKAQVESVEARGRLLTGAEWRAPIRLVVSGLDDSIAAGKVVELCGHDGETLGAMAIDDIEPEGERTQLGGPVFVYQIEGPLAADTRAELLRESLDRTLAVPEGFSGSPPPEWAGVFDGVFSTDIEVPPDWTRMESPVEIEPSWLGAAIAQNMGATAIWVDDPSLERTIRDTLKITPMRLGDPAS